MRWSSQAQHAPSPVQSLPADPAKVASRNVQSISGGTVSTSSASALSVSATFSQVENRLARIQPMTPTLVIGAGRSCSISARLR